MRRSWLLLALLSAGVGCTGDPDETGDTNVAAPFEVTSAAPGEVLVDDEITVTGFGFQDAQGTGTVTIGAVPATVVSWTDAAIVALVPDVMPGAQPIVVTNADDQTGSVDVNVVLPPVLYVNLEATPNLVAALSYDATTATFTELAGSPYAAGAVGAGYGGDASSVHVNAVTRRLFASNDAAISVYDIDPITGALTEVIDSPYALDEAAGALYGLMTDAAGRYLYVGDYSSDLLHAYAVAEDGALTELVGSPYPSTDVDTLMMRADGKFLYANNESNGLEAYAVAADGTLTRLVGSPFGTTGGAFGGELRPGSDQVFLPCDDGLRVFDVGVADGVPAELAGSPFDTQGTRINSMAFAPDGGRLWVGDYNGPHLNVYDVAPDGTVAPFPGSPVDLAGALVDVTSLVWVSRDGAHLTVVSEDSSTVTSFALDATTGLPTAVPDGQTTLSNTDGDPSGIFGTF